MTQTHNLHTETGEVTDTVDGWTVSCECDVRTLVTRGALRNLSEPLALLPYKSIFENDFFLTGGRDQPPQTDLRGSPDPRRDGSETRGNLWDCERTVRQGLSCFR